MAIRVTNKHKPTMSIKGLTLAAEMSPRFGFGFWDGFERDPLG